MPVYEYECPAGHVVEKLRAVDERDAPVTCTTCADAQVQAQATRVLSATGTNFRENDRTAFKGHS